METTKYTLSK